MDGKQIDVKLSSLHNVKSFSAVVHFIQKIGKEIIFELDKDSISLQALNDAKSAFAMIDFPEVGFFDHVKVNNTNKCFTFKIAVKPLCAILAPRNLKALKKLNIFSTPIGHADNEIIFELTCNRGIRRTHRFPYQDTDVVNAVFEESPSLCSLRSVPKVFSKLLEHTQSAEIALEADRHIFRVKSFHHDRVSLANNRMAFSRRGEKSYFRNEQMSSAMTLETREFEEYHFRRPRAGTSAGEGLLSEELIFCVREVRGFLGLCDATQVDEFMLQFSEAGKPIRFSCSLDGSFAAQLVMATMVQRGLGQSSSSQTQSMEHEHEESADVAEVEAAIDLSANHSVDRRDEFDDKDRGLDDNFDVDATQASDDGDEGVGDDRRMNRLARTSKTAHRPPSPADGSRMTTATATTRSSNEDDNDDEDIGRKPNKRRALGSKSIIRSIICSESESESEIG